MLSVKTTNIPAQEEIQPHIMKKKMSLFEIPKKKPDNLEKLYHAFQSSPHQWNQKGLFQPFDYLSQNSETD